MEQEQAQTEKNSPYYDKNGKNTNKGEVAVNRLSKGDQEFLQSEFGFKSVAGDSASISKQVQSMAESCQGLAGDVLRLVPDCKDRKHVIERIHDAMTLAIETIRNEGKASNR